MLKRLSSWLKSTFNPSSPLEKYLFPTSRTVGYYCRDIYVQYNPRFYDYQMLNFISGIQPVLYVAGDTKDLEYVIKHLKSTRTSASDFSTLHKIYCITAKEFLTLKLRGKLDEYMKARDVHPNQVIMSFSALSCEDIFYTFGDDAESFCF